MRREDRFDGGWKRVRGRGGGLGGKAMILHLVEDTEHHGESDTLAGEGGCHPPTPTSTLTPTPHWTTYSLYLSRMASGLSSSLLPACSPGGHQLLG